MSNDCGHRPYPEKHHNHRHHQHTNRATITTATSNIKTITAIISTLLITSAVPGDADTNYRIARSFVYRNFIFLGFVSRDNVIRAATGWSMPLATQSTIQMFGITLFCATQLGATNITVRKTKSA